MSAKDEDLQRIKDAVDTLSEHFDSVQVIASRHEAEVEGGTVSVHYGIGNWYARVGHAREWLTVQDERTRQQVRSE